MVGGFISIFIRLLLILICFITCFFIIFVELSIEMIVQMNSSLECQIVYFRLVFGLFNMFVFWPVCIDLRLSNSD